MPKLNEMYPSRWLTCKDLDDEDRTLTMKSVEEEEIAGDTKWVLYFREEKKGLVLNKTNSTTIAKLYGEDSDDWEGKKITLFPTQVDFQGKTVDAIRVKTKAPKPKQVQPVTQAEADETDDGIPF